MRARLSEQLPPSALLRKRAHPIAALAVLFALLASVFVACGGSDDAVYSPGPLACDGHAKKSYHYTASAVQVLTTLPVPPAVVPDAEPITLTSEIQGAVEGGGAAGSIDGKQHNATQGGSGDVEVILLENGDGFYNIGRGWTPTADPSQLTILGYRPLNLCNALAPDADTTKLGVSVSETINGIPSLKFTFQDLPSQFTAREPDFGAGSDSASYIKTLSGSVWVAEKGNLITKLDLTGTGRYTDGTKTISLSLKFEVSDLGADIKVRAPV